MKGIARLGSLLALALVVLIFVGCASTSTSKVSEKKAVSLFKHPIAETQKAAITALTVTGFDITQEKPSYVEGSRPRKVGLVVGSGGEVVAIQLISRGAAQTEVKVDTRKSFVGYAGQKIWDDQILTEIGNALGG